MTTPDEEKNMTESYREDLGDLDKLPAELREQIKGRRTDKHQQILDVIEGRGGRASINEILVGLWRKTGKVSKRPGMAMTLSKMCKNNDLWKIRGEIIVYSTTDPAVRKAQPAPDKKPAPKKNGGRPAPVRVGSLLGAPVGESPPLDPQTARLAEKAYNLRKGGQMDFGEIAVQLSLRSADSARFMAKQYAKENNKPWPV